MCGLRGVSCLIGKSNKQSTNNKTITASEQAVATASSWSTLFILMDSFFWFETIKF